MNTIIAIQRFTPDGPPPPARSDVIADPWSHHADIHLRAIDFGGFVVASCSVWHTRTPALRGRRVGFIGHYRATTAAGSCRLLDDACAELLAAGCDEAVGPMDGTTWRGYRLVTESSPEPPFFTEPTNPVEWPMSWRDAGFAPLAGYHSALNSNLRTGDAPRPAPQTRGTGFCVRDMNMASFDEELHAIYRLSCEGFDDNFLYSPISWEEFAGLYRPLRTLLRPEFVRLVDDPKRPGELAGFLLAIPDVLEQERTGAVRTLILKSMAVHPLWRCIGLGTWLIADAQAKAAAAGMTRAIFALMHDDNRSARIGSRYGHVIRRYTLFVRSLRP